MKLSTQLAMYRRELKRSKNWRSTDGYEDDWKRYVDLYKGKHYSRESNNDQLIVNLIFSTINTIAPSVAVNNPRFVVNARNPEKAPQAVITEEVLNYLWRSNDYQDEFRLAVNDLLIVGHAWCKVGYKFVKPAEEAKGEETMADPADEGAEYGVDDREDIPGNVESEMFVQEDRPFLERISPLDMYVDPDARHTKEMSWIAQRTWRPLPDVNVDSRYSATQRKKVSATAWSKYGDNEDFRDDQPDRGPKQFVEVIEYYDIKRRTVCTFALDGESDDDGDSGFLIKPAPWPYALGHPFEMLRGYEIPDHFYTIGDVAQIESLQLELNQTRNQMMNHRKRFQRKWLYAKDAFDQNGIAALEADIDNTMIPVEGDDVDMNRVIIPMPAVTTPGDFYDQSGLITNDIDRVSGISDYQRGSAQTAVKRTATEAAMIQDAANARAQDRLRKIESSLARLGERVISLMQQFMTGEQVARIVTMPGKAWVPYDHHYIQGKFDFEVAAGSTEPMNETFRRQSAMQLVDASMPFMEAGVANMPALYQRILQQGFGVKDASPYMQTPPPPQVDPATGQPQEVPPGGPPPPGQPPMPPQGVPQQAPMDAQMPPDMDPAMMEAMMAGG